MPNHVINEIRLHGVDLEAVKAVVSSERCAVDFQVLLPLPLNFWPGSVSSAHEQAFPGTHLDAARNVWGTKWNAYGDPTLIADGADVVMLFQTAWSAPRGWTVALFNKLKVDITVTWLDGGAADAFRETYVWEPKGSWSGMGPEWKKETLCSGSPEHLRMHKLYWGESVSAEILAEELMNDGAS